METGNFLFIYTSDFGEYLIVYTFTLKQECQICPTPRPDLDVVLG